MEWRHLNYTLTMSHRTTTPKIRQLNRGTEQLNIIRLPPWPQVTAKENTLGSLVSPGVLLRAP